MKTFPFRMVFLCLLIPPFGYLLSLNALEAHLESRERATIERGMVQNREALLDGRWTVRTEIQRNLDRHFAESLLYALGVRARVVVKTQDQRILYPVQFFEDMAGDPTFRFFSGDGGQDLNYVETAAENFRVLNEGFDLLVDVRIRPYSWISGGVLLFWVLFAGGLLYGLARRRSSMLEAEEEEQQRRMEALSGQLAQARTTIQSIREKEAEYRQRIEALRSERETLTKDVDELLEEMDGLEGSLGKQQELRETTEKEMVELREEVDRLRRKLPRPERKEKELDVLRKRFRALYKNLSFTDRSLEGLAGMSTDFQIRAEETLQALNDDVQGVAVKRKVFGKGGKSNILEASFAYSGRLYFHRNEEGVSVLAIGTKNSQKKDLAYLQSCRTD